MKESYTLKYNDYSKSPVDKRSDMIHKFRMNQGLLSFPEKLHQILANNQSESIITWIPHGRAFEVKTVKIFESSIIPQHCNDSKYSFFVGQLNAWGFRRITHNLYFHELFLRGLPHLCSRMDRLKRNDRVQRKHEIIDVPKINAYCFANPLPVYSATPSVGLIIPRQQNNQESDSGINSICIENNSKSLAISNYNSKEDIKPRIMCKRNKLLNTSNDIVHLLKEISASSTSSSSSTKPDTLKSIISSATKNIFDDAEKKTSKFEDNEVFKNTNLALYSKIPAASASNVCETDYDVFKNTSFCHDNHPQFKQKQSLSKEAALLSDALISNSKGRMKTKLKLFEQKEYNLPRLISMQDFDLSNENDDEQIRAVLSFTFPCTNSFSTEIKKNDFAVGHKLLLMPISSFPNPFSTENADFDFEQNHDQSITICPFTNPFDFDEFNPVTSKECDQLKSVSPCKQ